MGFLRNFSRQREFPRLPGLFGGDDAQAADLMAEKFASISSYYDFCKTGTPPKFPLEVFVEISNLCDLKCAMCVTFSALNSNRLKKLSAKRRGFIDNLELLNRLDEVLRHALVVHCFGYGEPTLHPKFGEILDSLVKYRVVIDFFTNGMHLTPSLVASLVDKKVQAITISFSGATKEIYENIYLGGKFEQVLAGIKRLADYKKEKKSHFPVINVNSLGFKEHIANLDPFVRLMAEHGVNVIHVKPIQPQRDVPQLYEHIAVPRPEIEVKAAMRAVELGEELGVKVDVSNYVRQALSDNRYQARMVRFRKLAAAKPSARPFGENPLSSFRESASTLEREKPQLAQPESVILGSGPDDFSRLQDIVQPEGGGEAGEFYCMEPFKTLYVLREGRTKPCCFSADRKRHMGDIAETDPLQVWQQGAFGDLRSNVVDGRYPKAVCGNCLKARAGPPNHFAGMTIAKYLSWYGTCYGDRLSKKLDAMDPRYMDVFKISSPDLIEKVRVRRRAPPPAP